MNQNAHIAYFCIACPKSIHLSNCIDSNVWHMLVLALDIKGTEKRVGEEEIWLNMTWLGAGQQRDGQLYSFKVKEGGATIYGLEGRISLLHIW